MERIVLEGIDPQDCDSVQSDQRQGCDPERANTGEEFVQIKQSVGDDCLIDEVDGYDTKKCGEGGNRALEGDRVQVGVGALGGGNGGR